MLELLLLNAWLLTRDSAPLSRNGLLDNKQWSTHGEAFSFIKKHLEEFGELPSVATVIESVDNFEASETTESLETLCKKLVERNLKNAQKEFLVDIANKFGDKDAYELMEVMEKSVTKLQTMSSKRGNNGMDWSTSGQDRQTEYESRKKRDFSRRVPFMFEELTEVVGEMNVGFYLSIMAFTAKGKTWLGLKQALAAHEHGMKVLFESGEMSKPEVAFRLDTLKTNLSNRGMNTGSLDKKAEERYLKWLAKFSAENGKAPLIIKSQEDWPKGLTLYQIEHDIQVNKPDMVIIDQFSLIKHKDNDKAATSRRLKEIAGKHGVVIVLLYQANGDYEKRKGTEKNEDREVRELVPPRISDYSETIAVIQDVDALLSFDSVTWIDKQTKQQCGKALLCVAKSRQGGEGEELDLQWIPDFGLINVKKATDAF